MYYEKNLCPTISYKTGYKNPEWRYFNTYTDYLKYSDTLEDLLDKMEVYKNKTVKENGNNDSKYCNSVNNILKSSIRNCF